MKKLNGNLYFESKDVIRLLESLITTLGDRELINGQIYTDRLYIEKAITDMQNELLFALKEEVAVKIDYIEEIYTQLMYPAVNLLSPDVYARSPVVEMGSKEIEQVENWFYNYGLLLSFNEFKKNIKIDYL